MAAAGTRTVLEILQKTAEFFESKGVESARLNAEWIVGHALGLKRMQLYLQFERVLNESELERIRPLVRRRGKREPLQYILGETEFAGLALKVDPRALIPRPETEYLMELVLARTRSPGSILDLGTGSGAIALALARHFQEAKVTAVDLSQDALALASENASATGLAGRVRFIHSNWYASLPSGERFDLIVANPPYLTEEEWATSAPEVRAFEPASALASAEEGVADLMQILDGTGDRLQPGGLLAMETGIAHHATLRARADQLGLEMIESLTDLTKRDRYLVARARS